MKQGKGDNETGAERSGKCSDRRPEGVRMNHRRSRRATQAEECKGPDMECAGYGGASLWSKVSAVKEWESHVSVSV